MNGRNALYLAAIALVISIIAIGASFYITGPPGEQGEIGPRGPEGPAGVVPVTAEAESCVICHEEAGAEHQASYDELYQDGVITVTDLTYEFTSPDTHVVTFSLTEDGEPIDSRDVDNLNIGFIPYTGTAFQFEPAESRLSIKGTLTYDSAGVTTSTLTSTDPRYAVNLTEEDGLIVVYGYDGLVGRIPDSRVRQVKYPYAALLETGDGVDYVSPANNEGCEKCHSVPYLKHGNIYAQVNGDASTDMYTCKYCHLDNGEGGHFEWQLSLEDPELWVEWLESDEDLSIFTPEQLAMLAYNTSLMNDVHRSHSMEFAYPQSMSNCATCHEGKLDAVLTDENFTWETCISCHAVTGSEEYGTDELALATIIPPIHGPLDIQNTDCALCHNDGGVAPFNEIHTGYDKTIYAAADLKYSEVFTVTIDEASFDGDTLTINFSAVETPDLDGIDVEDIEPTVLVGLYGYDTRDYIIGPHERLFDDNGDGEIDRDDERTLEYDVGEVHPRFTTVTATGGSWQVIADLSSWTDMIEDGNVTRVEIAVTPALENADGDTVALNAPSRTFDLSDNEFDDDFFSPIVKVEDGCNNCHDALATTYHSPDRGGSIVVCKLCHITKSGASHLEMQSRSIESYIHSIHSFQVFDIDEINFTNPVEALHYEHHIGTPYPTHEITDCESCHYEGTYEIPDQTESLPGVLSDSETLTGWDREIGDVPSYVTGPGSIACGSCHRAEMINEDDVNELIAFNQHTKQGGYLIEIDNGVLDILQKVIDAIMAIFD